MEANWPLLSVLIWLPILGGLLTLAFGDSRAHQGKVFALVVAVATANLRAQKIPLRLGFKQVSLLKKAEWLHDRHVDHYIYSLAAPAG